MRQHSGALEQSWNRQFTKPIFPAGTKNAVWERDYLAGESALLGLSGQGGFGAACLLGSWKFWALFEVYSHCARR